MSEEKKDEKAVNSADAESSGDDTNAAPTGDATDETSATAANPSRESHSSQKSQEPAGAESAKPVSEAKPAESEASDPDPAPSTEPDWKDLYARLRADFDNFKKRTARDREDTYRYAEADILKDILPTVDNLALALANAVDADGKSAATAFVTGVRLVYDTLLKSLKDHGAEPFDCVGGKLDTEKMEAIATLPSETVAEGLVSNEVKRGWMLKDKVLRAAQVVVSSGKPADE